MDHLLGRASLGTDEVAGNVGDFACPSNIGTGKEALTVGVEGHKARD